MIVPSETVNFFVLLSFFMHHEQFKIVASVENVKVVYNAFFCCFFQVFLCDFKERFGNDMVSS